MNLVRRISLVKGSRRYVFRYQAGRETNITAALASLAADAEQGFDWSDAVLLDRQMGQRLEIEPEEAEC